ncbi:MAG: cysteine hydrolase [Coriobacteriia bacterium]|nr:cysteine hydrolase [Coriobacteriia bacterium]MCL2537752.1 cysteine hydrolase [Coriobacteriia bacterium]
MSDSQDNYEKWPFVPAKSALLVIDMQNDFVREGAIMEVPDAKTQLEGIAGLIESCRTQDIPVIYTVHQTDPRYNPLEIASFPHLKTAGMREGTDGIEVVSELTPRAGDYVLRKRRYSAFFQTDLEMILRNMKVESPIDTLIICGTVTNICCESTARDAYFRDFKVVFGSDVCSALSEEAHVATLANMELFGRVMSAQQIIEKLKA